MSQTPAGVNFLLTLTAAGHTVLQVTRFFLLSSNSNQLLCNWLHKVWPIFVFWQRQMDKTMCHQIFILGAWKDALDNDKKKVLQLVTIDSHFYRSIPFLLDYFQISAQIHSFLTEHPYLWYTTSFVIQLSCFSRIVQFYRSIMYKINTNVSTIQF